MRRARTRRETLAAVAGGLGAANNGLPLTVSAQVTSAQPVTLAVRDVTLLDGTDSPPKPNSTVLVSGDRIEAVLDRLPPLPDGTSVVDGSGLTLLPGLIDTHVHWEEWMAPLFLQYGVTTVRDVGNSVPVILDARLRERRGTLRTPRIVTYGPRLDGTPPAFPRGAVVLSSVESARTIAENHLANGLDGLKVYARLPVHLMRAVVAVATAHGVPVAAHVGVTSAREAVDAGVRSIEHVFGVSTRETQQSHEALASYMADKGVFLSATLQMQHLLIDFPGINRASFPHLDALPPRLAAAWLAGQDPTNPELSLPLSAELTAIWQRDIASREAFLRRFYEAGGRVTTGSDVSERSFIVPGLSLHQELERLVETGLSPTNSLRAATGIAAELLQRPDLGTVGRSKLADLVLVDGDPASAISVTQNIRMVLKGGTIVYENNAR